ncbi:hypothetical protein ACOI9X_07520 [Pseudomonas sp. P2757]|uniref:hypothetical protein n=1 Tax=unclassified Pseudomonas TaxID=196821 RepID=UPI003B59C627
MNQKRTRIPLPHPPPYRQSRASFWLLVLVGVLIAFAFSASVYQNIDSLLSGSITTTNRGPRSTYTLALQPRMYWFEFWRQCVGSVMLLVVGVVGLWVWRKASEPAVKPKGKGARR